MYQDHLRYFKPVMTIRIFLEKNWVIPRYSRDENDKLLKMFAKIILDSDEAGEQVIGNGIKSQSQDVESQNSSETEKLITNKSTSRKCSHGCCEN